MYRFNPGARQRPVQHPHANPVPSAVPTPVPPPPTADPYQGFYYRILRNTCTTAGNTRIEGMVYNNGTPQNGVTVRVSYAKGGPPVINDFVTGTDPTDYKHVDPSLQGKYRPGLYEGQQNAGNWFVFIINSSSEPQSPSAFVNTHDGPGCNTATVDFGH